MNDVGTVALRLARRCVRPARFQSSFLGLRSCLPDGLSYSASRPQTRRLAGCSQVLPYRAFSHSARSNFRQSQILQKLKPYGTEDKPEKGLDFQDRDLDDDTVVSIFGEDAPDEEFANRLLRILHGRRVDGTLDLPLPEDIQQQLEEFPTAIEDGLKYLRQHYEIDEDEAIINRFEREEDVRPKDHPSVLMQRGMDIGLYKAQSGPSQPYYGPQSGYYGADLNENENNPYGKSELDRMRRENDAKREKEDAELQEQIDLELAKAQKVHEQKVKALALRPEQAIEAAKEIRSPNKFEKWRLRARNRGQSKLTTESPEIAQAGKVARLVPSFLMVAICLTYCYYYAETWTRPKQNERYFPQTSLAFATIAGLVAVNAIVWIAWKMPPAWATLNKYFLTVPAYPYVLSQLGSAFSHQSARHLGLNMFTLILFGLPLHEEIGRGNFLALYLASGLIGGYVSFARYVLTGNMVATVLGASNCTYGVFAAYLTLHDQWVSSNSTSTIHAANNFLQGEIHSNRNAAILARYDLPPRLHHLRLRRCRNCRCRRFFQEDYARPRRSFRWFRCRKFAGEMVAAETASERAAAGGEAEEDYAQVWRLGRLF
jgi:membrane associated rhomboid family serine protease